MGYKNKTLKIFTLTIALIIASLPSTIGLQIISKNSNNFIENAVFNAFNINEKTIEIKVNPINFKFGSINTKNGIFATVELPDFGFTLIKGEAKLPIISKMIEIPQMSKPEIVITSIDWKYSSLKDLKLPDRIIPVQQSVEKIPEISTDFEVNSVYYSKDTFIPQNFAKIVQIGEIRSRRFALVEISPIQYKPSTGELKIMKSCEITINLPESNMIETYNKMQKYYSLSYEKIFNNSFENYGFYEKEIKRTNNSDGYLAIVYDEFYDAIQPLVKLKTDKGFKMNVVNTSDIPGGPTTINIQAYIKNAYDNWEIPPSYILLVGDTPQIPTFYGTTGPSATDLYYVTVDGSDYFPDIFIGRFPAASINDTVAMVEKTVYYELGDFQNFTWIKKAAFLASNDNYAISEGTHNYVIDRYLNPNGYTCNKLYSHEGATTQQVRDAINDGRSLVIYSGHGSTTSWADGPPFSQSDVIGLTNQNMYPFVCSHACLTNSFDIPECFGETWLRQANKGAIAFWGASDSTYWNEDDVLERAMFQSWWEDGIEWTCGMTDMALMYLYENYSGGGNTKYYFEAYNLNGDPSLRLWSDNPSLPPKTPQKPNGPDKWVLDFEATFKTSTTDPEGDDIYYMFDWGDGNFSEWLGPFPSGEMATASHIWTIIGNYEVRVRAKDIHDSQSNWSEPANISIIVNTPPQKAKINGPKVGITQKNHDFSINSTDPNGDDLYYYVNWGDGDYLNWVGPYKSGETVTFSHTWSTNGNFVIIVIVKDQFEAKSPQSEFNFLVIKNRALTYSILTNFFENVMERTFLLKNLFL